jgi:type I restriction enzyme R subunit
MNIQPEQILEDNLVKQLNKLGYESVKIKNESELLENLKNQLEKHNNKVFSKEEFARILNHLNKGNVFERSKILRDKMPLRREDGSTFYVEFLNQAEWCKNQYQVTNQVEMVGKYKNRYDVTLLINGLPLVQIELKRRGLELKEAFNQIDRYQRHSFWASNGLFSYVQLFVISNGVNTKYFANNYGSGFKQTFYWADKENNLITNLDEFAESFLEKCQLSKMICKYIVLHESDKLLMILRPYQYYAVENLIERVKDSRKNGYIWHTTGSGKTLTSFKAAQLLMEIPKVFKIVFVVDRSDLDWQTTKEFNHFSDGSVDGTDNTRNLVKQLENDTKLIVTTIQKLNTAISKTKYLNKIEYLKDKRVVFIFDECHRSQFGETHKRIKGFFDKAQMFGFTGTPIFADNASKNQLGTRTTKDLFDECLHKYVITNAIKDENVLKFGVEYWGRLKKKDGSLIDEEVKGIDIKEFFEHEDRISQIVDWIILNHNKKTHNKYFSAMLCVGSKEALIKYYEIFKAKKLAGEHNLRIATIFTYGANEDDANSDGLIPEPNFDIAKDETKNKHSREKLDEFIEDYNKTFQTKFSTDSKQFYNYYRDIAKKLKSRERTDFSDKDRIDILLVVNMYLTGFDAKKVNTLYVDKNLKNHGLIQAFSRTNRILNEIKSQGNIVCFRNLKKATDDAISLFSNPEAKEKIIIEPYEDYLDKFNEAIKVLKDIVPNVDDVNNLSSEREELAFVKAFRNLMRLKNILQGFADFKFDDLEIEEQEFEDYKSKYLDIYDKVKKDEGETTSIINDVDFELELIQRDEVNVAYILGLLANLYENSGIDQNKEDEINKKKNDILDMIGNEARLRSKKELIERFIEENLPRISKKENIKSDFAKYWDQEREKALAVIRESENLVTGKLKPIIDNYLFSGIEPASQDIVDAIEEDKKPKILERKKITTRIMAKIKEFIRTFEDDIGNIDG